MAVLGHQRPDKGFQLMAEIAAALLATRSDIRVLAHNGDPAFMPEAQECMRQLARADSRVTLDETIAGPEHWARLLDQSDLVLCPYHPRIFAARYSAVAYESVANGIPLVVPARTSLAALLREFGEPGTTFDAFTAGSVVEAAHRALDEFDRYAERAWAASEQWSRTRGPQKLRGLAARARSIGTGGPRHRLNEPQRFEARVPAAAEDDVAVRVQFVDRI